MNVNSLPLRHRVGQLLIIGFDGDAVTTHLRFVLRTIQPGGVILFKRNLAAAQQCFRLLEGCSQDALLPQFKCVDLEGGTVDRFREIIAPAPSAEAVARAGKKKLFARHGELIGKEVRALGFNVDFAPVSDLDLPASKQVMATRTFSPEAEKVIVYLREFLKGLNSAKVLGCGKHFPGLGGASLDTHNHLPSIARPWKQMWQEDLLPYRKLRTELPFVMVAHANYPLVTNDNLPASLSRKWIHEILRRKIGYRGLTLSDDLEMGGVLAMGTIEEVAVETLHAGADMVLVCHKEELIWRTYEAILRRAEQDNNFEKRVSEAAAKVLKFKEKARELRRNVTEPTDADVRKLKENMQRFSEEIARRGKHSE